jgi:hypothetical protein
MTDQLLSFPQDRFDRQVLPMRGESWRIGHRAGGLLAAALALAVGSLARADLGEQGEQEESLFAVARRAVAQGLTRKSRMLGFSVIKRSFKETPAEGAILIGFDLGLGKSLKQREVIYALRPIYLTAEGETTSRDYGLFDGDDNYPSKKKARRGGVTRTVQVKARSGYAVGGISLRTGVNIHSLSVTFMRIRGRRLDPRDSYTSGEVGTWTWGRVSSVKGSGAPVVGVFGNRDGKRVLALGLIYLRVAGAPAEAAPARPRRPKPTEPEADKEEPAKDPVPPPQPPPDRKDPPANPAAAAEKPAPRAAPKEAGGTNWLPYLVFGGVAVVIFPLLLLVCGRKKQEDDPEALAAYPSPPRPARTSRTVSSDTPNTSPVPDQGTTPAPVDSTAFRATIPADEVMPTPQVPEEPLDAVLLLDPDRQPDSDRAQDTTPVPVDRTAAAATIPADEVLPTSQIPEAPLRHAPKTGPVSDQVSVPGTVDQSAFRATIPAEAVVPTPQVPEEPLDAVLLDAVRQLDPGPQEPLEARLLDPGLETSVQSGPPKALPPVVLLATSPPPQVKGKGKGVCPNCSLGIKWEAGRPWCPHCGADLNAPPKSGTPAAPPIKPLLAPAILRGSADVQEVRAPQPPFFQVRCGRLLRVYVLPDELLLIEAGSGKDHQQMQSGWVFMGGLIGGLIAGALADQSKEKDRARQWQLDTADTDELIRVASWQHGNVRAPAGGLCDVRIEPTTCWQRWFVNPKSAGWLHLGHRECGQFRLEFLDPAEVRRAIDLLSALLGERLAINVVWDYAGKRYVRKP